MHAGRLPVFQMSSCANSMTPDCGLGRARDWKSTSEREHRSMPFMLKWSSETGAMSHCSTCHATHERTFSTLQLKGSAAGDSARVGG